jgi:porin
LDFDLSLTQFYQGAAVGGAMDGYQYGGKVDLYLNADAAKAFGWQGLKFVAHVESRYGEDVNNTDGLLTFGNFNMAFPTVGETSTGITAFKLMQQLGDNFMLIAGKINTLDDFRLGFTGKNGRDRFMNSAVVANVINARTIPYSTYGAGFSLFAENGPEFTFLARDTANHPTSTDFDALFANGVVLTGSLRVPVSPFGLPGTQVFGGNYSTGRYSSIDPSSWINIPGQGVPAPTESGSWAAYWNFDQCLWVDPSDGDRRWGIFGMTGISDGNPNSVRWNATVGIGVSGLIPGRKDDTFGAGYFYVATSDNFKDFVVKPPEPPGLAQRNEQGVELYYNAAITRWCNLTFDLQAVEPSTRVLDTTLLLGVRLKIDF